MSHYSSLFAFLACILVVRSQTPGFNPFITPSRDQKLSAGKNFDILWTPANTPPGATVSIKLLMGKSIKALEVGQDVAVNIPANAGRFTWPVSRSIRDNSVYQLKMTVDGNESIFSTSAPFDLDNLDNNNDFQPPAPAPVPAVVGRPFNDQFDDPNPDNVVDIDRPNGHLKPANNIDGTTPQAGGSVQSSPAAAQGSGPKINNSTSISSTNQKKAHASIAALDLSGSSENGKYPAANTSSDQPKPAATASGATSLAISSFSVIGGIATLMIL